MEYFEKETDNGSLDKLEELLEQDQFELLLPIKDGKLRLVYLMNDAVESFLTFQQVRMTGEYLRDYEGELSYSLSLEEEGYVLVVYQGDNAVTLFFQDLEVEAELYDYGAIGHFWVEKWEDLRQIEYRLAILRDKYVYLGEDFCTKEEILLAALADFPPLNYCCYPAVPEKYLVTREGAWEPSEEAFSCAIQLAKEEKDQMLLRALNRYKKKRRPSQAKRIARMLRRKRHTGFVELLEKKLRLAASVYPARSFGKAMDDQLKSLLDRAEKERDQMLQSRRKQDQKRSIQILRQEPFVQAQDSIDMEVYLLIRRNGLWNRKVYVKKIQ